jgi:hypothetical protein
MPEVKLLVRTADQSRKAEIAVPREMTAGDVVQAAIQRWSLPADTDYTLVNTSTGRSLAPAQVLDEGAAREGDLLEVQPVLVAGRGPVA